MKTNAASVSNSAAGFNGCGWGMTTDDTLEPARLLVVMAPTLSCSSPVGRARSTTTNAQRPAVRGRSAFKGRTPV